MRLTTAAEADFQNILRWTTERFSDAPARVYAETLSATLEELSASPKLIGVKTRNDIVKGLFTLHVARHGRKGRHFVMFRIGHHHEQEVIEVLRLLHDAMDLSRHVTPATDP